MSIWKKFVLTFTANTLIRLIITAGCTWFLIYTIQLDDIGMLFFGIAAVIAGYVWVILNFLDTFQNDFYVVQGSHRSEIQRIIEDVQCLKRITKLRDSIASDACEEVYFEEVETKLENLRDSLK
jgi:hypothetical protein